MHFIALYLLCTLQLYVRYPARMEVPVQLPIVAVVSVDGLDGHAKKVFFGWHCS